MIVLFLCYLREAMTQSVTSDGASIALQAWDMLHGNLLLHGWTLADVTFYTTELPELMVVELLHGFSPVVVHLAAALSYVLLVLLAGVVAKGRATGREGAVRLLIAAGIMVAPQLGPGAFILLLSPDHVGTEVPMLLIWLLIDRGPRRWWVPALAGLALAWVIVGDQIALSVGVAPLAIVCAVRAYQAIVIRREPWRSSWFEIALGAAALASYLAAAVAVRVIGDLGGYITRPLPQVLEFSSLWPVHLATAAEGILGLYGADFARQPVGLRLGLALVHLVGLALAAWALCHALRRFFRLEDLLVQVLVVAIVINLFEYVASTTASAYWGTREIAAVLPFGAILAGRLLAGRLMSARLLPALAAAAAVYVLALASYAAQPPHPLHDQALASWLKQHHLSYGLGSYAEANSTVIDSHGTISVRAPGWFREGIMPSTWESERSWFDPHRHYANFVVSTSEDGPHFVIPYRWVLAGFGPPASTYHHGPYTIWVWHKNLLADMKPGPHQHHARAAY